MNPTCPICFTPVSVWYDWPKKEVDAKPQISILQGWTDRAWQATQVPAAYRSAKLQRPHCLHAFRAQDMDRCGPDNGRETEEVSGTEGKGMKNYTEPLFIERKERINKAHFKTHPMLCPVIEQTGDGNECGTCCFYMPDGKTCPRHGVILR